MVLGGLKYSATTRAARARPRARPARAARARQLLRARPRARPARVTEKLQLKTALVSNSMHAGIPMS